MSKGRGQWMAPAASPGDHGHMDTAPWCVAHQLLPRDSGALGTAETLTPRAWPCALTCTFRKQAAQAGPARVSTFLHLELSQGTPATSTQPLGLRRGQLSYGEKNMPSTPTPTIQKKRRQTF